MEEPLTIVHVMRRCVPEKWGGTECAVFGISRQLILRGSACRVHCTSMLSRPGRVVLDGVPVFRHPYVFPWFGLSRKAKDALRLKGGSPLSLPLFWALLREKDVSVIHAQVQHRLGGMARTAARLKGIPYVVSLHGGYFTLPQEQIEKMTAPFSGRLEWGKVFGAMFGSRRVLQDADGILCVGRDEYEAARERYPGKPVFLVPNGVDTERFSQADGSAFRAAHGYRPSEKIVLCVSRIDYQKNQLGLVRAFARFVPTHPHHRLVLIGPVTVEAYRDEVVSEVERLGLAGKVRLIEGLRPDDPLLPSAYKAAEQFVLPSRYEPFGIVVLEAWAAGLPVLASRTGGLADMATHRENALLVDPDCEESLVAGMTELADDALLRAELARKAFGAVSVKYAWNIVTDQMRGIYEQVVRGRSGKG